MNTIVAEQCVERPYAPKKNKYPWATMAIEDSFFVPDVIIVRFSAQAVNAGKRFGRKFSCRTMEGGVRVWRIA